MSKSFKTTILLFLRKSANSVNCIEGFEIPKVLPLPRPKGQNSKNKGVRLKESQNARTFRIKRQMCLVSPGWSAISC